MSMQMIAFVILSVRGGKVDYAKCFRPNLEQTEAPEESLDYSN